MFWAILKGRKELKWEITSSFGHRTNNNNSAMDIRFTAMDHDTCSSSANGTTTSSSGIQGFLPPWSCSPPALSLAAMRPCQALTSAGAWGYALVGQCFSRVYRVQFDEEHQRSLLSCHSTEGEDGSYAFPDEAMLELRRRVLKVDADSHHVRKPTFAKDLDLAYPVQVYLARYTCVFFSVGDYYID